MAELTDAEFSQLLQSAQAGQEGAAEQLFNLVYFELRRIARQCRHVGAHGSTMQATVLANEAYLEFTRRFTVSSNYSAADQDAFFRSVALAMRTILRDYWRQKNAEKRGGGVRPLALDREVADEPSGSFESIDFLDLDEALGRLEAFNPRWYAVVAHRYFAGRSNEETANMLGVGISTVKSDWQLARAWLRRAIEVE